MTRAEFDTLKNPGVFTKDYRGQVLMTPQVMASTKVSIARLIDGLQEFLKHHGELKVVIHCLWEKSGHTANSKHYTGIACDFHLTGCGFLSAYELVRQFLEEVNLADSTGWGLYPDWNYPGFHLDLRGKKGRWGYYGGEMRGFDETLKYARDKFGKVS
ncbi:MAG: hypothetical protein A2Y33_12265 [Spirochaetes bacterium GWF1_51_8]|nr:MAG: hypothetical protein A2Y33_12265 [Spirochaetes bacterium GWF1_51_8]